MKRIDIKCIIYLVPASYEILRGASGVEGSKQPTKVNGYETGSSDDRILYGFLWSLAEENIYAKKHECNQNLI
jgi:hypothetical protein